MITRPMPASGLLALLDDIATIADDVATLSAAAAKKTSGIVTDDMAVTAEQAIGIRRERELPVIFAVAKGSFRNKALILAPGALALNAIAPWAITPLLMLGGGYLAFEGVEKILHWGHSINDDDEDGRPDHASIDAYEQSRIHGAIRTDLILSAEIIAICLGLVKDSPFLNQVLVLYTVSIVMTVGVYGVVAVLIKLDDAGEYLMPFGGARGVLGKLLLAGAPKLLHVISLVGTFAMLMVGGGIFIEGIPAAHHAVEGLLHGVPLHGLLSAGVSILGGGVVGLVIVALVKLWGRVRRR